jgi:hypothetical protein
MEMENRVFEGLPEELVSTARRYAAVLTPATPPEDFRVALRTRLVSEAARLQQEPAPAQRSGFLIPAAVGAAIISVAGLALLGRRSKTVSSLLSRAQSQFQTVQGSS